MKCIHCAKKLLLFLFTIYMVIGCYLFGPSMVVDGRKDAGWSSRACLPACLPAWLAGQLPCRSHSFIFICLLLLIFALLCISKDLVQMPIVSFASSTLFIFMIVLNYLCMLQHNFASIPFAFSFNCEQSSSVAWCMRFSSKKP